MKTQLDYKMKTFFKNYDSFSYEQQLEAKVSYLGKQALMMVIMFNFELELLEQELKNGNTDFSDDKPYPDEYWLEVVGFEENKHNIKECDSLFRQIMNKRDITNYTPQEALDIIKYSIRKEFQNEL